MIDWAKDHFKGQVTQDKNGTVADHIKAARRLMKDTWGETEELPFPEPFVYLWSTFLRLRRRTATGFNGANPITPEQIQSWQQVTGEYLSPYDVNILFTLDDLYLDAARDAQGK